MLSFSHSLNDPQSLAHRFSLLGIVLLGLVLRLYSVDAGHGFHYFSINDEVSAYQFIIAFLAGEPYAQYLAQPLFAGAQVPGPLWTLYGAGLYLLGGETASGAIYYSAVLNSMVVYLFYRLARNFIGPGNAILMSLLFAVMPWPIYHAAGLWNPTVLPMLGSLLFLAMWRSCSVAGSRAVFWVCLLLAAIPQCHMIGIFYIPVALLLMLLLSPRLNWRWLGLGIAAGFSLYLPYLIGEYLHGWSNTRQLFSEDTGFSWGWLKIFTSPPSLISALPGSITPDNTEAFRQLGDRYFGSYILPLLVSLLTLLVALVVYFATLKSFVAAALNMMKRREVIEAHRAILFIGGLIFLPVVFFAITGHGYASRYALLIMPLLFLLPAMLLEQLSSEKLTKRFPMAVVMLAAYSCYLGVASYQYKADLLENSDLLMPSFNKLEEISALLNEDAGEDVIAWVVLSQETKQHTGRYKKVYDVFPTYVRLDQKYKYKKSEPVGNKRYRLHLATEVLPKDARVIYRDASVVITPAQP